MDRACQSQQLEERAASKVWLGEQLDGARAVRSRVLSLAATCTESLWSLQPGGPQGALNLAASRHLDDAALRRGISIRTIYLDSVRNDHDSVDHAARLAAQGADLRTVPTLPMRMLLVDRRIAVVPIDPAERSHGAIVVSHPGMVSGLVALFVTTWRTGVPFARRRPERAGMFSRQEREALQLWAQGLTDKGVAKRLGVSERTARRISSKVTELLGTTSRFQAGVRAAELELVRSSELLCEMDDRR